ncbi:hypothetical protein MTO96_042771 [Rhipicephalus appendiculatus]
MDRLRRNRGVVRAAATWLITSATEALQSENPAPADLQVILDDLQDKDTTLADLNKKTADLMTDGAEYEEELTAALEYHDKIRNTMSRIRYLLNSTTRPADSTAPVVATEAGPQGVSAQGASEYAVILHRVLMRSLPEDIAILYRQRMKETETNNGATPRSRQEEVRDVMKFPQIQIESREESSRSRCLQRSSPTGHDRSHPRLQPPVPSALALAAGSATNSHACCVLCGHRDHSVKDCQTTMTADEIRGRLIERSCCFKCAREGHTARQCRNAAWLRCKHCAKRHLTVLCEIWKPQNRAIATSSDTTKTDSVSVTTSAPASSSTPPSPAVLMQTATVWASGRHDSVLVRILLDTGSQRTFVRRDLSTSLDLPSVGTEDLSLLTFGSSKRSRTHRYRTVQLKLQSRFDAQEITMDALERYQKRLAVNGVSFGLVEGEVLALLGVSGSGKSTLLRMIAREVPHDRGRALMKTPTGHIAIRGSRRRWLAGLGYCPQDDWLIEELTGFETLALFARLRGVPESHVASVCGDIARLVGLDAAIVECVAAYSAGMRRRLSVAVALVGLPPLVLLDEPTVGVDMTSRRTLWEALRGLQHVAGTSVVITTGSMEEVEVVCDRLTIMIDGEFQCMGSLSHLKDKFAQGFTIMVKTHDEYKEDYEYRNKLMRAITETFRNSKLQQQFEGFLEYHMADTGLLWSDLFAQAEAIKLKYNVLELLICATTMDHVYAALARWERGRPPQDGWR